MIVPNLTDEAVFFIITFRLAFNFIEERHKMQKSKELAKNIFPLALIYDTIVYACLRPRQVEGFL